MYVHMQTCMYIMYVCTYIHTYICMHARIHTQMYVLCTYVTMYNNMPLVGNTEFCVLHKINSDVCFRPSFVQYTIPEGPKGIMALLDIL
jgi:hypothetical protein